MKTYTQHIEQARKQVDQLFQRSDFASRLSQSATGILGMIFAIQEEEGDWVKKAVDEDGQPLFTPAEQERWTTACEPYLPFFRGLQHGGAELPTGLPAVPSMPSVSTDPLGSTSETPVASDTPEEDSMGPDDLFEKAFHQYEKANATIHQYVSKHGPIQLSSFDKGEDLPVFPKIMTTALQGYPATKAVGMALEKVKAPPRTLYVLVYLLLDMARTTSAVMGADQNRKLLSVVVAVLDLLRGDWKKAVLSLLGYAGSSPLYLGQLMKVYLAFFQMINPRLQQDIIFGTWSLGKSLLIGGLLSVFQVTAPASVRLPIIEMLEKLAERKTAIDEVLMGQGLAPRSDDLSVSFEHLERLQTLMDDTQFVCSKEYEELTSHVQNNFALRMVFQLVGIPTTILSKERRCGKGPARPLAELVVRESLDHPERKPAELQEEMEPVVPTVQATNDQVRDAIQIVDQKEAIQEKPSEPIQEAPQKETLPPTIQPESLQRQEEPQAQESKALPPTIQKQESQTPEPLSTPLPPTIRKRGGRSLRRGQSVRE